MHANHPPAPASCPASCCSHAPIQRSSEPPHSHLLAAAPSNHQHMHTELSQPPLLTTRHERLLGVTGLACCRAQAAAAQEETGVRPGAEAPFQCPLTGRALNGCGRTLLHRPTALVFTDSGLKKAPGVARELLLEAANKLLAADGVSAGEKKGKKKAAAAARLRLEAVVARGGRWDDDEMLVLNPEGDDAEVAKGRQHAMQTKVSTPCWDLFCCRGCRMQQQHRLVLLCNSGQICQMTQPAVP